jgi:hypothetical protein
MSIPSHEEITPNQYHLNGGDISVSYYPEGAGPIIQGRGRLRFTVTGQVIELRVARDIPR